MKNRQKTYLSTILIQNKNSVSSEVEETPGKISKNVFACPVNLGSFGSNDLAATCVVAKNSNCQKQMQHVRVRIPLYSLNFIMGFFNFQLRLSKF